MDETGGGVEARCFGDASTDGYYYFYRVVEPGSPEPRLRSRYTIPRPQGTQECVSHNATVIPVDDKYLVSAAYYQGGVSVVDFTDVEDPQEVASADVTDATGTSDEWSSYWYNGRIFSNSGLGREGPTANRGVDVWRPTGRLARDVRGAERWDVLQPADAGVVAGAGRRQRRQRQRQRLTQSLGGGGPSGPPPAVHLTSEPDRAPLRELEAVPGALVDALHSAALVLAAEVPRSIDLPRRRTRAPG